MCLHRVTDLDCGGGGHCANLTKRNSSAASKQKHTNSLDQLCRGQCAQHCRMIELLVGHCQVKQHRTLLPGQSLKLHLLERQLGVYIVSQAVPVTGMRHFLRVQCAQQVVRGCRLQEAQGRYGAQNLHKAATHAKAVCHADKVHECIWCLKLACEKPLRQQAAQSMVETAPHKEPTGQRTPQLHGREQRDATTHTHAC